MKLEKFRVEGFQSFLDSGELRFENGFNLIVGQNNSGKSALLRSIHSFADDRHRSATKWQTHQLPSPEISATVEVSGEELLDESRRSGHGLVVPVTANQGGEAGDALLAMQRISIKVRRHPGIRFQAQSYPSHGLFQPDAGQESTALTAASKLPHVTWSKKFSTDDSLPNLVHGLWDRKLFHFDAERMSVGESQTSHVERLLPDASNLPAVLNTMRGDRPSLFDKLVSHVRDIFSTVAGISVRPLPRDGTRSEIRLWPTEDQSAVDLGFALNNSGTGVSQVLAILTAVMTVDDAVVVIDEINSFLHPAAVKALLRVLKTDYSEHQYIISTHSPDVIASPSVATLNVVRRKGFESTVSSADVTEIDTLRALSEELGVSISDVFAAERLLWVEGPTEALCFPRLYSLAAGRAKPRGTVISEVTSTGDVTTKRHQELVYEIYQKVSSVAYVSAAAFSLDGEELSDKAKEDMIRNAQGRLFFLPRRHIECYLVDADAIAAFINLKDLGGQTTVSVVAAKLSELAGSQKFATKDWTGNLANETWLKTVDAAKLIAATCSSVSGARVTFNKKRDSELLLLHLLDNGPESLMGLADYVRDVIDRLESF